MSSLTSLSIGFFIYKKGGNSVTANNEGESKRSTDGSELNIVLGPEEVPREQQICLLLLLKIVIVFRIGGRLIL